MTEQRLRDLSAASPHVLVGVITGEGPAVAEGGSILFRPKAGYGSAMAYAKMITRDTGNRPTGQKIVLV